MEVILSRAIFISLFINSGVPFILYFAAKASISRISIINMHNGALQVSKKQKLMRSAKRIHTKRQTNFLLIFEIRGV
jgi:hypothetical protein